MATPQRPAYYCHACAADQHLLNPPPLDSLATRYQLEKYVKHTVPDEKYQVQSVFDSTDTLSRLPLSTGSRRARSRWIGGAAPT